MNQTSSQSVSSFTSSNDLRRHSLELLEFPQIRAALASYAQLPVSRDLALALEPSYDAEVVGHRQRETAQARLLLDQIEVDLSMERDVRPLLERVARGGVLTGEEFHSVSTALELVRNAKVAGSRLQAMTPILRSIARNIPDLKGLEQEIRRKVTSSGELADDATPHLRQLRREGRAAYQKAVAGLEGFMESSLAKEVLQEQLITVRAERLVVPVKAEFRGRFQGIVHDVSDSGATLFVEPVANLQLTNTWREYSAAEKEEMERILRKLSASVAKQVADVGYALEMAGRIDFAVAKARYARATGGGPVEASQTGLRLVDARHPLLRGTVVPVSLTLEPPVSGLVVTGPNTGGKTVGLKALGLMVLMHQSGLQPTAEPMTRLPIFDGVYADIGDQQSIERSVSTFSSHMMVITGILGVATPRSLVLLDELGTSTDPDEGSALARAILAHLSDRAVPTVATTHHRVVAALAEELPALENASVELDPMTLKPTYRITMGLPGRSYAIAVAERLGLDADVLQRAKAFQDPNLLAAETLLASLQAERHRTRAQLQEAEEAQAKAAVLQRDLEEQMEEVGRVREQVVEETRRQLQAEAKAALTRIKQAESAVSWLPSVGAGEPPPSRVTEEAREEVAQVQRMLRSKLWGQQPQEPQRWGVFVEGDLVEISPLGFTGTLLSSPDEENRVEVLVGSAKVRLDVSRLRKVDTTDSMERSGTVSIQLRPDRQLFSSEPELDLRGMRLHEALERLDAFLDDALAQGSQRVRIIHGKGTGVLRQGVWKHLGGHTVIERYEFAPSQRGGEGATEVELG